MPLIYFAITIRRLIFFAVSLFADAYAFRAAIRCFRFSYIAIAASCSLFFAVFAAATPLFARHFIYIDAAIDYAAYLF